MFGNLGVGRVCFVVLVGRGRRGAGGLCCVDILKGLRGRNRGGGRTCLGSDSDGDWGGFGGGAFLFFGFYIMGGT